MKRFLAILAVVLLPASAHASALCTGDTQWFSSTTVPVSTTPFTVSVWFKSAQSADRAASDSLVFLGDSTSTGDWFSTGIYRGGNSRLGAWHRSAGDTDGEAAQSSATIVDATWQHALARYDSNSQRRISVDDANEATNTAVQSSVTINTIGVCRLNDSSPSNYWEGRVAEVAIWDVALSDANVTALAGGANPLTIDASNLIAYWPLKTDAVDAKGSNDLTNNGSATFDGGDHPTIASARRRVGPIIFQ